MGLWAQLQAGIKKSIGDKRRYELVTFAAANALRSTLCSLAHGKTLTEFFPGEAVQAMARGEAPAGLTAAEAEMMQFARKVARNASSVTRQDVQRLKELGFSDAEVFDIAAAASARTFFSNLAESLGVTPEHSLLGLDEEFKRAMAVGRPLD
jgi:alkylhydroperoxidase family enzyme